jgi:hypothetical protein
VVGAFGELELETATDVAVARDETDGEEQAPTPTPRTATASTNTPQCLAVLVGFPNITRTLDRSSLGEQPAQARCFSNAL